MTQKLTDLTYIRTGLPHWLSPKPPSVAANTPVITDADLDMVFDLISEGVALTRIIEQYPHLPPRRMLMKFINANPEIHNQYVEARALSAQRYEEKVIETIEDTNSDIPEDVNRSKLKVQGYQWAAAINDPKRYAPQKNLNVTTNIDLTGAMDKAEQRVTRQLEQGVTVEHEG